MDFYKKTIIDLGKQIDDLEVLAKKENHDS